MGGGGTVGSRKHRFSVVITTLATSSTILLWPFGSDWFFFLLAAFWLCLFPFCFASHFILFVAFVAVGGRCASSTKHIKIFVDVFYEL